MKSKKTKAKTKKAKTEKVNKLDNAPVDTWRYHWFDSFIDIFGFKRAIDKKSTKKETPKVVAPETIAIEDLIIVAVLAFCENAAELGCPRNKDVDMWFRELSYKDAYKVAEKMLEIEERNIKMYHNKD